MNQSSQFSKKSPNNLSQGSEAVNPKKKHLLKAAGVMGSATFTSRILGMVRDVLSAQAFGTSWLWDAFIYAFMIPNFFRRIIGEGALSSAFIPVFSEIRQKEGQEAAHRFANALGSLLVVGLFGAVLLVELAIAGALQADFLGDRLRLTLELLQTLFPYLWFISLYALCMGILNCHKHFFIPSMAPVILNVVWIVGVLATNQIHTLAIFILSAGLIQLAVQIPKLYGEGFRFQWIWNVQHDGIRKVGKLLSPAILSFAIIQLNLFIDMTLAFWIGPGANSSLWYGNRLMQFPLGIFTIAMGTALLPTISEQAAKKNHEAARASMLFAMRTIFFIILPCTLGLIALAQPIIELLFERGQFDATSTARTSAVLICYALGLAAFSALKMVTAGFHAIQDTKTPVKVGLFALLLNVILNLILMQFFQEAGLALATSISGITQCLLMIYFYNKKIIAFPFKEILSSFTRILSASIVMGIFAYLSYGIVESQFTSTSFAIQFFKVFSVIGVSILVYLLACSLLKVSELRELLEFKKAHPS